jgi:hypothetical protein
MTAEQVGWLRTMIQDYREKVPAAQQEDPDAAFTMLREVDVLCTELEHMTAGDMMVPDYDEPSGWADADIPW